MKVEIKSVAVENKGKYKMMKVFFTYPDSGKEGQQNLVSFGASKDAFLVLAAARAGQVFDIDTAPQEKNPQYNDWVKAVEVAGTSTTSTSSKVGTPRSNFETPEERAIRQVAIARQSSLERALEYFALVKPKTITSSDVISLADEFVQYVLKGKGDTPVIQEQIDNLINDDIAY